VRDHHEPVTITSREIYDAVLALRGAVDRLTSHVDAIRVRLEDHEERIRAGERLRWPLPSAAILVSLITLALAVIPMVVAYRGGGSR
jgi:hypothetical protein